MSFTDSLVQAVAAVREQAPLVHNITNFVVMSSTANALLAIGASPVMAHAPEEIEEMTTIAGAVVINIGTLRGPWIESMKAATGAAATSRTPLVLDPVGAGASTLRTRTCEELLAAGPVTVIRGNASEILALASATAGTRGVDSVHTTEQALGPAAELARRHNTVVCISGATDYVVDKEQQIAVSNGAPLMTRVTGMGCTATALVGAFVAVSDNPFLATAHAMTVMGIAGEMAAERCSGPGSLQVGFLDALHQLGEEDLRGRARVTA